MNRLQSELLRLYLPRPAAEHAADPASAGLVDARGSTRALVLEVARPADWEPLARVWRGVQTDLELPAPAVAVSGTDGLQVWFSLAEPAPVRDAHAFLEAQRLRYLPDLPSARVRMMPTEASAPSAAAAHAALAPAEQAEEGRWSAFVAPDLAALFTETPWLDIAPGIDGQADLLCRLKSIGRDDFDAARAQLAPAESATAAGAAQRTASGVAPAVRSESQAENARAAGSLEPREFLLRVMRDESVQLALRIEAAKALLLHPEDAALRRVG
ncbi:MAG: hypothetical protein ACLGII_14830 [Gammaproteobacteria bacterium]